MEDEDEASAPSCKGRHDTEEPLQRGPYITKFPISTAGQPVHNPNSSMTGQQYETYLHQLDDGSTNLWAPFTSHLDYKVACWAKLHGLGSTAFSDLLKIEGICDRLGLSYRSTPELNKIIDTKLPSQHPHFRRQEIVIAGEVYNVFFPLFNDPDFAKYLVFVPECHYSDPDKMKRLYHDLHTSKWWWNTQKYLEECAPSATIILVFLSTNKTQVTMFRNKSAYPIYMTIGNIPKEIQRKPSHHTQVLLDYLPTTKLDHISNLAARHRTLANLFHACMREILHPLKDAGSHGVNMTSGGGVVHCGHPLVTCYIRDYPEQILISGAKTGECPSCDIPRGSLGSPDEPCAFRHLKNILDALALVDEDPLQFTKACATAGMKPLCHPFWEDLPYCNIYCALTPNVLHQLYQGLVKHLIAWIKSTYSTTEIDAQCKQLPPNHNIWLFMKGISGLSHVSGTEHDQICRFLLGMVVNICLPGSVSPARLICAVRGLLDFLYLTQYPCLSEETLELIDDALTCFHNNKAIFIDLSIRASFELPKLHSLRHYVYMVWRFGTTDNYTTAYTEHLHIDLTKDAYRATNHKDEYFQMTVWLEQKEKMLYHNNYIIWRQNRNHTVLMRAPPNMSYLWEFKISKHPSVGTVPLRTIEYTYGVTFFQATLAHFVIQNMQPQLHGRQFDEAIHNIIIPFCTLAVFHKIHFNGVDSLGRRDEFITVDAIHVQAQQKDWQGHAVPGRFDTALVNLGEGGEMGVEVRQVGVIFAIPSTAQNLMFGATEVPLHLVYVEWFSPFPASPERNHGMYKISWSMVDNGQLASIVPVMGCLIVGRGGGGAVSIGWAEGKYFPWPMGEPRNGVGCSVWVGQGSSH
ncbi:hypothetical protein PAXRUDRAFT_36968 [Paxillus rubicundulus Ve08.2h10]|uniref:Uncharacterized protein n=1 Tax=Paxillus rubicundulus Ve08.2h10 TaxID=930991 RepID=A0A0D0BWM4_9AGAM|nr:hypothetical protein PAXRUDRAFT_36968 [Paxillus rubicundulus Ve08.2h10]